VTGANHAGGTVTQGAKTDLVTAYNTAAGEGPTSPIAADLGGRTLTPGVYNSASSIGLTGELTLNAGGDPSAVFIFQAGSSLTNGIGKPDTMVNGAQACNVFWQVGSSATLGNQLQLPRKHPRPHLHHRHHRARSITGRLLARNGAVTLDTKHHQRNDVRGGNRDDRDVNHSRYQYHGCREEEAAAAKKKAAAAKKKARCDAARARPERPSAEPPSPANRKAYQRMVFGTTNRKLAGRAARSPRSCRTVLLASLVLLAATS